jgi:hypothetical protein
LARAGCSFALAHEGAAEIAVDIGECLVSKEIRKPFYMLQCFFWPGVSGCDLFGVESENVRYGDLSGITLVLGCDLVLAVEVLLKRTLSSCKVVLSALRALAKSTVFDVPGGGVRDAAGFIASLGMQPEMWASTFTWHNPLMRSISASVV